MRDSMRRSFWAACAAAALAGCGRHAEVESPGEVRAAFRPVLPDSPADEAWAGLPVHDAALLMQDMVDPRLMEPSTGKVRVQAATDGTRIAFRLRWDDQDKDDLPGSARFADACAVQLPAAPGADSPAPQMGEEGRPVEITYWSAFWQASVDGRPDTINAIYPGARVDHYPFQAAPLKDRSEDQKAMALRYAPARNLGNPMSGPRTQPVQDLTVEGPGTLRPAPVTRSEGRGVHQNKSWAVLLKRPLPAKVGPGGGTVMAVAVWRGDRKEAGARKMRSGWVSLSLEARP